MLISILLLSPPSSSSRAPLPRISKEAATRGYSEEEEEKEEEEGINSRIFSSF